MFVCGGCYSLDGRAPSAHSPVQVVGAADHIVEVGGEVRLVDVPVERVYVRLYSPHYTRQLQDGKRLVYNLNRQKQPAIIIE